MKRFRQFVERELPKNIRMQDVEFDQYADAEGLPNLPDSHVKMWTEIITSIHKWLTRNDRINLVTFDKYQAKIPAMFQKGGTLYRGMAINDSKVSAFLELGKIESGWDTGSVYIENGADPWTRSKKVAEKFTHNAGKPLGILITKKIPDKNVLLDIEKFVHNETAIKIAAKITKEMFSDGAAQWAEKESEVIVTKLKPIPMSSKEVQFFWWPGKKNGPFTYKQIMKMLEKRD